MFLLLLLLLVVAIPINALTIVPQPASLQTGTQTITLNPTKFSINAPVTTPILLTAITRYKQIFFAFGNGNSMSPDAYTLTVTISSTDESLFLGVDESYTTNVGVTGARIDANTVYGALRGLETIAQVIDWNSNSKNYTISRIPIVVTDSPRFIWRGLLLDTARHFLDVPTLKRHIDALAASKMNTLHWHVTDAQSFPMYSATFPFLAEKGAFDPSAIYSHNDVLDIVQYGKERGIRVVPEFDIPGHAASWGAGNSSLTVYCSKYAQNINNIPLDPTNPYTFVLLQGFFSEMSTLFSDMIHTGGDEVVLGCWLNNSAVVSWMKSHGMTTATQLLQYFEDNLHSIFVKMNRPMVVWNDLFDMGISLDKSVIIQVWNDKSTLQKVVAAGYKALLSAGWYLNQQQPNPNVIHGEFFDTWIDFYQNDPLSSIGGYSNNSNNNNDNNNIDADLVIGGEVAMWGEQADMWTLDGQVWPRSAAVAERLWSPQTVVNVNDARVRLSEHSCRLQRRGIRSTPLMPGYCVLPNPIK